jgi:hypothetical protein
MTFRYDDSDHSYWLDGQQVPSITQMIERAGLVDSTWLTQASRERGTAVHALTASYDLGAIERPASCSSPYKGYLLAHVKAVGIMRPEFVAVEEPRLHSRYRFGGRPDRAMLYNGLAGVLEIKTAEPSKAHECQTALQAILESERFELPAEALGRFCLYLKPDGRFRLEEHRRRRDFDVAFRLIREQCG